MKTRYSVLTVLIFLIVNVTAWAGMKEAARLIDIARASNDPKDWEKAEDYCTGEYNQWVDPFVEEVPEDLVLFRKQRSKALFCRIDLALYNGKVWEAVFHYLVFKQYPLLYLMDQDEQRRENIRKFLSWQRGRSELRKIVEEEKKRSGDPRRIAGIINKRLRDGDLLLKLKSWSGAAEYITEAVFVALDNGVKVDVNKHLNKLTGLKRKFYFTSYIEDLRRAGF